MQVCYVYVLRLQLRTHMGEGGTLLKEYLGWLILSVLRALLATAVSHACVQDIMH